MPFEKSAGIFKLDTFPTTAAKRFVSVLNRGALWLPQRSPEEYFLRQCISVLFQKEKERERERASPASDGYRFKAHHDRFVHRTHRALERHSKHSAHNVLQSVGILEDPVDSVEGQRPLFRHFAVHSGTYFGAIKGASLPEANFMP